VIIPDTLVWLGAYYTAGRETPLLTLAHDGMFDAYPGSVARTLSRMGALRAGRDNALAALRSGCAVQVYPGGDHDACRSFWRRNEIVFAGRTGYVELARDAGVPIVPIVSIGGHETLMILWDGASLAERLPFARRQRLRALPLSLSVPWGLWLGPLPGYLPLPAKIVVRVLDPIDPTGGSVDAIDRRVRASMQAELDELAEDRLPWIG
jgi:1-acyl-sn-glycerol-3-phosphate acyltransferase